MSTTDALVVSRQQHAPNAAVDWAVERYPVADNQVSLGGLAIEVYRAVPVD